jgi:hypothetical protein
MVSICEDHQNPRDKNQLHFDQSFSQIGTESTFGVLQSWFAIE